MMDGSHQQDDEWYSDSGASQHVCGNIERYVEYQSFDKPRPVFLTDKRAVYAKGQGIVAVTALMRGKWIACTLNEVLHIPGAANLFSEVVMAKKGYTITRTVKYTTYKKEDGSAGPEARPVNNMYVMNFQRAAATALRQLKATSLAQQVCSY
jgi:hypothetical protein